MPGFDRSGPVGNGPMTGGARGLCGSAAAGKRDSADGESGFFRRGLGCRRGFGGRRGGGFGRGTGVSSEPVFAGQQDSQRSALEIQLREMQQSLEKVQRRLDEL